MEQHQALVPSSVKGPVGVDALAHLWPNVLLYAFPPLSLISPTLARVREQSVAVRRGGHPNIGRQKIIQLLAGEPWPLPLPLGFEPLEAVGKFVSLKVALLLDLTTAKCVSDYRRCLSVLPACSLLWGSPRSACGPIQVLWLRWLTQPIGVSRWNCLRFTRLCSPLQRLNTLCRAGSACVYESIGCF